MLQILACMSITIDYRWYPICTSSTFKNRPTSLATVLHWSDIFEIRTLGINSAQWTPCTWMLNAKLGGKLRPAWRLASIFRKGLV